MTEYEISPKTLSKFRRRFAFTLVVLISVLFLILHRFLQISGHDSLYEEAANLVISGGCMVIWIG